MSDADACRAPRTVRLIIRGIALLPTVTQAEVTQIMPLDENPGAGVIEQCQLKVRAGWQATSDVIATDEMTGDVLFLLRAGSALPADACINAPPGHSMLVEAPPGLAKLEN